MIAPLKMICVATDPLEKLGMMPMSPYHAYLPSVLAYYDQDYIVNYIYMFS